MKQLQPQQQDKKLTQYKILSDALQRYQSHIAKSLPKHISPDRFIRVALTSAKKNPVLLECEGKSVIAAIIEAAQLGLELDGALGHAYLVPYRDKKGSYVAQLQIGYKGFIDLARRSGRISSICARVVYDGDRYEVEFGLNEKLTHVPARPEDRGDPVAVYAVARFHDGGYQFEWMWVEEIERIRKMSKASDSGPWITHWEEMAKKTVIRRLIKYLPLSPDISRAVTLDEYADAGIQSDIIDVEFQESENVVLGDDRVKTLSERLEEIKQEVQNGKDQNL